MSRHVSIKAVGLIPIGEVPASDPEVQLAFLKYYNPFVSYKADEYVIRKGCGHSLLPVDTAMDTILGTMRRLTKTYVDLMCNESEYGLFSDCTLHNLRSMVMWLRPFVEELASHRQDMKEGVRFADMGAGQNTPSLVAWLTQCWKCVGLEGDLHRAYLAACTAMDLYKHDMFANLDVGLYHRDIRQPQNWAGFHVYYCRDATFTSAVREDIIKNIHRSCTSDPVLIILSTQRRSERLPVLQKYFDVHEHELTFDLKLQGSGDTDRIQAVQLTKRFQITTPPVCNESIASEAERDFSLDRRDASYNAVKMRMHDERGSGKRARGR